MLIDPLPECVKLGGEEYPIHTGFRTSILFELMMEDYTIPEEQKVLKAIELYYPERPPVRLINESVDGLLWFYRAGKNDQNINRNTSDESSDESSENRVKRIYSFEYDDEYIYAAFLEQYGVDLEEIQDLHWWKFKAMFKSLRDDCQFCKIMGYRSMKITNKMTKEQKAFYRRMKAAYALPVPQEEAERIDAITQALLNGGDLTGLI